MSLNPDRGQIVPVRGHRVLGHPLRLFAETYQYARVATILPMWTADMYLPPGIYYTRHPRGMRGRG